MTAKRLYAGCLAFLSGATGLSAQIVWLRKFGQVFGGTVQAASVVVAATLLGLALGAYFLGQRADKTNNRLAFAGWLAVLTGIALGLGVLVFGAADAFSYRLARDMPIEPAVQFAIRAALAAVILLPPSILLGGMLPALVRVGADTAKTLRTQFGVIYGMETAGGAVGGLLTGFGLIRWMGLNGTLTLASAGSVLIGVLVLLVSRTDKSGSKVAESERLAIESGKVPKAAASAQWCHLAVALAGFASLGMEILWTRLLLLVLGGDSFAYTTVVTSYLLGLALGALLARRIAARSKEPRRLFAWFQIGVAATSLLLLVVFMQLAAGPGQRWLALWADGWGSVIGGRFGFCLGLLLLPTIFVGLSVPTLAAHLLNSLDEAGRKAGRFYAANTLGNVTGALATGFLLLPLMGVQSSFVALVALNLAAALLAVLSRGKSSEIRPAVYGRRWMARAQLALVIAGLLLCASWQWLAPTNPIGIDPALDRDYRVSFYREGPVATVMVLEHRDQPDQRLMAVDGVIIGESEGGVDEKQRMLAHLPFLIRPDSAKANVLTIGLGTGILAGELVGQAGVQNVVCVELSPAVIDGAKKFADLNGDIQRHPNVTIAATDGIHYLRRHDVHYDAIISDAKSRPGHVGNVSFFSRDYYQLCQSRLTADGVFVQWVSLETPHRALQIILRTFVESFPHAAVGVAAPDSLYLVGAAKPLQLDVAKIQSHLESSSAAGLRSYGWRQACDVLGLIVLDGRTFQNRLVEAPINTLDRPHLEFEAGEAFQSPPNVRKLKNMRFLATVLESAVGIPPAAKDDVELTRNCQQSARLMLEAITAEMAHDDGWLDVATAKYQQALKLAGHHHRLQLAASSLAETHQQLALAAREAGDLRTAAVHFHQASTLNPNSLQVRLEFATTLTMLDKPKYAEDQLRLALNDYPDEPRAHFAMGIVLLAQGEDTQARQYFRRSIELDDEFREKIRRLGITGL